jgi:hypothetical protein
MVPGLRSAAPGEPDTLSYARSDARASAAHEAAFRSSLGDEEENPRRVAGDGAGGGRRGPGSRHRLAFLLPWLETREWLAPELYAVLGDTDRALAILEAVAVVYAAGAFVAGQAADIFLPRLGLPDWTVTLVVVLAVAGFPVALILGWVFDITPAGVRRTGPAPETPPAVRARPGPWRLAGGTTAGLGIGSAGFRPLPRKGMECAVPDPAHSAHAACIPFLNDTDEAEDACQEVLVRSWIGLRRDGCSPSGIKPYVLSIFRNVPDETRRARHRASLPLEDRFSRAAPAIQPVTVPARGGRTTAARGAFQKIGTPGMRGACRIPTVSIRER